MIGYPLILLKIDRMFNIDQSGICLGMPLSLKNSNYTQNLSGFCYNEIKQL